MNYICKGCGNFIFRERPNICASCDGSLCDFCNRDLCDSCVDQELEREICYSQNYMEG
jgi:hypothetical protein